MAGALLTRSHVLFAGIWPAWYLLASHRNLGWRHLLRYSLLGVLPVAVAGSLLAAYNSHRFGGMLDFGLDYHLMDEVFAADYARFGAFSLHYVASNAYYQLLAYPFASPTFGNPVMMGGSLFLLSPVFFAAFWAVARSRPRANALLLVATIVCTDIPILLLMGTGWVHFGPRYTLDFTVPLLLLTALGLEHWSARTVRWLTEISLAHYICGAIVLAQILDRGCANVEMVQVMAPEQDCPYAHKAEPWSSHSRIVAALACLPPGTKILDVGTATGTLGQALSGRGFLLHGIEPNPSWARVARAYYAELDCCTLDGAPENRLSGHDAVACADVLEHLADPEKSLRRLVNLEPVGCRFVISVPNVANVWVRLNLLLGRFDYGKRGILDGTHLRFFTRASLLRLVAAVGLQVAAFSATPVPLHLAYPRHKRRPSEQNVRHEPGSRDRGLAHVAWLSVCRASRQERVRRWESERRYR